MREGNRPSGVPLKWQLSRGPFECCNSQSACLYNRFANKYLCSFVAISTRHYRVYVCIHMYMRAPMIACLYMFSLKKRGIFVEYKRKSRVSKYILHVTSYSTHFNIRTIYIFTTQLYHNAHLIKHTY